MSRYLYLPLFASTLALAGVANADDGAPARLAQAPHAAPHESGAPCLTQDISSLSMESDFSAYMAASCPADVRIKAFRQLWRQMPSASDPDRVFGERQ